MSLAPRTQDLRRCALFNGFGASLLDYKDSIHRVGTGFLPTDLLMRAAGASVSEDFGSTLGLHRVIGQRHVLPQPAECLDAQLPCQSTELEVEVERLHVDASSLRQLREAHNDDLTAVRAAILELVRRRGKLHNPQTNSGGMLSGTVRAVGARYAAPPAIGARVASLASLTLTPLRLDALGPVDRNSNSIDARGTAFLFQSSPWTPMPADIPENVALAAFDVAGAPARVRARTQPGSRVLIVGAGNSGSLASIAAAEAGAATVLVTDVNQQRLRALSALGLSAIRTVMADAIDAVAFAAAIGPSADLCVSCVDRPGVEPACILATKPCGHVLFFSMATDFARAALSAEGVGSGATLEIGNGLYPGHADQVVDLLRRHPAIWRMLAP
jgi:L-erythro-3,5-diaminohexanoate dehydrogenase